MRHMRRPHLGFVKLGEEFYPCSITNMSNTGATLRLDKPIELPQRFGVRIGVISRSCSLSWHAGEEVSVLFELETREADVSP